MYSILCDKVSPRNPEKLNLKGFWICKQIIMVQSQTKFYKITDSTRESRKNVKRVLQSRRVADLQHITYI